jgi:anti-sigma factor RsiW
MNCRTCHFELSQCLDGRLPSGRRAIVMAHVAECEICARFWTELQRAQELVLRLPRLRVGADFRDRLFERIEAGEGTPPAVFHEPVPVLTKVRYALTGAAAAAAVLVVGALIRNQPARAPETRETAAVGTAPLAARAAADGQLAVRSSAGDVAPPFAASPLLAAAKPVTTALVAVEAAKQFQKRFAWTTRNLARLDQTGNDPFAVREVCANTVELKGLAELLLDLREDDLVAFDDPRLDYELRFFVQRLEADTERLQEHCLDTVRRVVAPTVRSGGRLGRIFDELRVRPTADPHSQLQALLRLSMGRPEVFPLLFIVLPEPPPFEPLDFRSPAFLFRDACGTNLVAPRSEVEEKQQFLRLQIRQFGGRLHIETQPGR